MVYAEAYSFKNVLKTRPWKKNEQSDLDFSDVKMNESDDSGIAFTKLCCDDETSQVYLSLKMGFPICQIWLKNRSKIC